MNFVDKVPKFGFVGQYLHIDKEVKTFDSNVELIKIDLFAGKVLPPFSLLDAYSAIRSS